MRMRLPEEEERMFDLFTQWLYNKGYEILPGHDEAKGERFMEPVKLYILADKYGVTDLKSHIITELFAMGNEKWIAGISTVAYAFEHTPQNSRLRKLLADWWVCRLSLPWFRSEVAQGWLKEHPEVACALIANTVSEETRTNVFVKVGMVEEYKDTQRVSE